MDPEYSTLQWWPMPHAGGPQPETVTCLFSDGFGTFQTGWWSRTLQQLFVPQAQGTREVIDHREFLWWAKLDNLQGFATERAPVEGIEA